MEQLPLIKSSPTSSYRPEDYILSKSNLNIYQQLIVEEWQQHCIILYGPPGAGKSHLANIWRINNHALPLTVSIKYELYRSYLVEDIERIDDDVALLHLYNSTKENKGKLLLTTNTLPKSLPHQLPDLRSRLLSVPLLRLVEGDEYLLKIILFKEFSTRQMRVSPGVINFIINHAERSIHHLLKIVDLLDQKSLQNKQNITIPFVKKSIDDFSQIKK